MDITSGPSPSGQGDPESVGREQIGADPSGSLRNGRLHRCRQGRMLAGVAGGVAEYFDLDPTVVRVGFVALALVGGLAVPLYLAAWLLVPEEGSEIPLAEELLARERVLR